MADTAIEWTERTWNPIVGCSLESPGCKRCYAMKMAGRLEAMGVPYYQGMTQRTASGFVWTGKTAANNNALMEPMRRRRRTTWFVNSMSDLFHPDVPDMMIDRVFAVMALCQQHTFQVLTKRAARMREYIAAFDWMRVVENCRDETGSSMILNHSIHDLMRALGLAQRFSYDRDCSALPLPNVWLGVSVEDQKRADERIPDLIFTQAAVRFVSVEPLLGPVDLTSIKAPREPDEPDLDTDWRFDALEVGDYYWWDGTEDQPGDCGDGPYRDGRIDWVIVGGESGPGARPMHPQWVRALRDQCAAATVHGEDAPVPFFFKQWGNWISIYDRDSDDPDWRAVPKPGDWDKKRFLNLAGGQGFHGDKLHMMRNVGKKAAGRLLDGIQHDGVPT